MAMDNGSSRGIEPKDFGRAGRPGWTSGPGGTLNGTRDMARPGLNPMGINGFAGGGVSEGGGQGTRLSNQQYQEYLRLLKERAQSQQVVRKPLNAAEHPSTTLNAGVAGLGNYGVTQPGYRFLAPASGLGKPSGYGGLPSPRPSGPINQIR